MGNFRALILILALLPAAAHAVLPVEQNTRSKPWFCGLQADLKGEESHFIVHGRDLWAGQSQLICDSGIRRTCKPVEVTFRSRSQGFGADGKSVLRMALVMLSHTEPHSVVEQTIAADTTQAGLVTWRVEKFDRQIVVDVLTEDLSGAANSLKAGTLSVREPPAAQPCP